MGKRNLLIGLKKVMVSFGALAVVTSACLVAIHPRLATLLAIASALVLLLEKVIPVPEEKRRISAQRVAQIYNLKRY